MTSEIDKLKQMVEVLWNESKVRRANEAYSPQTRNPHLRRTQRVISLTQRPAVSEMKYGLHRALVIDTRDPCKVGRVKVYIPGVHVNVPEQSLVFVERAEMWGALEDQGSAFVPPAGSEVWVAFEGGNREQPVVVGCLWPSTRGQNSGQEGGFILLEEQKRWGGAPGYRIDQKNPETNPDPKYLMPPWNNESYNGKDNATGQRPAIPHIYGIKSPEKHFLQIDDGNFEENFKGKRVVLQTSRGSTLYMKDDEINKPDKLFGHKYWDDFKDGYPGLTYKSARPYNGHTIELMNTGAQLQSFGGARLILSDELEENKGKSNTWSTPFDPGKLFRTFICLQSITEHKILLRDHEWRENMRDQTDGIFAITATGHYFGMEEDTLGKTAGPMRRIYMHSTSNHSLEMNDFTAQIASPRKGDGSVYWTPGKASSTATRAFFRLKSGWGQIIEMNDLGSQQENKEQFILIRNQNIDPLYDCRPNWPPWNFIRMDCVLGDRRFLVWGAGRYSLHVCHNCVRMIHKGSDFVFVRKGIKYTEVTEQNLFDKAQTGIIHWTVQNWIHLWVGIITDDYMEFPPFPVVIARDAYSCPFTGHLHFDSFSEHVFASE